jgi:cytochrome c oxidase subunit IV
MSTHGHHADHAAEHAAAASHDEHGHVGWKKYTLIGAVLAVITLLEVAIFYIDALEAVLVPALLVLSAGKFFLVVFYYMHLKMDHPIFGRVFWAPMVLAVLVVVGMVILFKVLPDYGVFS